MLRKLLFFLFFFLIVFSTSYFLLFNSQKSQKIISPFISYLPIRPLPTPTPFVTTLIAVGDIMLGRNVNKKMHDYNDFLHPFRKVADFTSKADVTFGNLESSFFDKCPIIGTGSFTFCADYRSIEGLKSAGFDILSLENNHILNFGKNGLEQTKELLLKNQISPSTASEIAIKQVNNTSFGFLSFNLTFSLDQKNIIQKVKENVAKVDVLIVSLHWGEEYKTKPAKWQVNLAHQLIDLGVKVILGHHSHVTGESEEYHGGLIFYSLGNFVFDQMWSQETREGLVAKINFEGKEIKDFQTYKVLISDYSQPDFLITPTPQ